ncbi:hypothetical protein LX32DRAFT_721139 [Colletotrichum zoysiae]|uniref:Uncharacterized protein n=1 Tax=Colletotrichum zoysiae TaxID=1216348 RepID=A0AAD9HF17_9PEZI|nr:hypothetical protein LX32DRAFT_721139 [Colletotrichum zoysiae]
MSSSSSQPPKPPIVNSIRNAEPLPQIPVAYRSKPKALHQASESARQVALPKVLIQTDPAHFTKAADDFLDANAFPDLDGMPVSMEDPSLIFHRNESDVTRSIEHSINREVSLVLIKGHDPAMLSMDSTTQAWSKTVVSNPKPWEPSEVTRVPDWVAKCTLKPFKGRQIKSTLVLEYKDRGLTCVDEILRQCTEEEWYEGQAHQAMREIRNRASGPRRAAWKSTVRRHQPYSVRNTSRVQSTLGRKEPCAFTANVETLLQQVTTYAVAEGAPRVGLTDYLTLILFEFLDLPQHRTELARLRAGPGRRVRVVVSKDNEHQSDIRRILLGVWLQSIQGQ